MSERCSYKFKWFKKRKSCVSSDRSISGSVEAVAGARTASSSASAMLNCLQRINERLEFRSQSRRSEKLRLSISGDLFTSGRIMSMASTFNTFIELNIPDVGI